MTAPLSLPEKVLAITAALSGIPHAFGGALSLAYYAEPRATADIDLNVFIPEGEAARAVAPLRRIGVDAGDDAITRAAREGQVRLSWETTPVDLFFSYDAFHDAAEQAVRRVPFAGDTIPILSGEHLAVCKVVFNRPRDWVDIDAMREAGAPLDAAEIIRWVQRIVGDDDARYERIVAVLTH